jgi:hypothetical protein
MTQATGVERLLRELSAPRRNHYFYGKLMDVAHFEMEQTYVNGKRWLLNQHALGSGTLCGLRVTGKDDQLWVEPGMAIDGHGREIIKPVATSIDPWTITEPCATAQPALSKEARHEITLLLCYKECLTDYMPVLVSDCGSEQSAVAGTAVETFQLAIRLGAPSPLQPVLDPRCCAALHGAPEEDEPPTPGSSALPRDERNEDAALRRIERLRQDLCRCTSAACPSAGEPCIVLAAVELLPGGRIGAIEQCRHRQRIYSNQVLLDLILCLAARLQECCQPGHQPAIPPKVAAVEVLDIRGDILGAQTDPSKVLGFQREQLVRSLRLAFTQPVDPRTVVAGSTGADPRAQSFLVMEKEAGLVPGTLTFESPTIVRWTMVSDAASAGRYMVRLSGDADVAAGRPAVASIEGLRLDGEPLRLPSGDDVEGGIFQFRFDVADEIGADEPPKVGSLYVVSSGNVVLAYVTDPRDEPTIEAASQPRSIRIDFTADIDPASVVATATDPRKLNWRVTDSRNRLIPGAATFEGPAQVRWTAATVAALGPGTFTLQLFGDADKRTKRRAIAGVNGLRLDGEPVAELPSGDGAEGGEFRFSFRVVGQPEGGERR